MSSEQSGKGMVKVGDTAPDFTLPDQSGKMVSLADLLSEKNVVLFFYPKDNTPGCTREACAFRDSYEAFREAGAEVIGISSQSSESHTKFASGHNLQYTLLSDEGGKIRKLYGAMSFGFMPGRVTYVIDKKGVVRHVFSSQLRADKHIDEALQTLKAID